MQSDKAAGRTVDDEKRIRLCDASEQTASWNYSFTTSGHQEINIIMNLVQHSGKLLVPIRKAVFAQKHDIEVNGFLSASWQPVLAILFAILSSIATIIGLLLRTSL